MIDKEFSGKVNQREMKDAKTRCIGVHVGNHDGKNFATMFHKNLFVDFMLPVMSEFMEKYGG